jgi:Right handed beta helix region
MSSLPRQLFAVLTLLALVACSGQAAAPAKTTPLPTSHSAATTVPRIFYVAANAAGASDSNDGTSPDYGGGHRGPWLTIRHAAQSMVAGDTTYVRAGTYYEAGIRFARSGEPGSPITLANYQTESVTLDGSKGNTSSSGIEIANGQSHLMIKGLTIRNMGRSGITTLADTSKPYEDITIQDCILTRNGLSGARLTAVDGFLVDNIEAGENSYYGLEIASSENGSLASAHGMVRDSSFHHQMGSEGHGLAINQGHDITVSHNRAFHNTIHGFDVSDMPKGGELSHDILVEGNISSENGVSGFSINSNSHHVVFRGNVALGNGADWAKQGTGNGFLCYEGCWHVEYYNNTSVGNTAVGFQFNAPLGATDQWRDHLLIFKNNIAFNNGRPEWAERGALVIQGSAWQVVASHNNWGGARAMNAPVVGMNMVGDQGQIYRTDEINRGVLGKDTVSVDPQFADLPSGDFHLQPGSPMIDAGTHVGAPFCGAAPDMGAFEVCP